MCVCVKFRGRASIVPRWWNFDIVVVWITGAGSFFFFFLTQNKDGKSWCCHSGAFLAATKRATVRVGGVLTRAFAIFRSWDIESGRAFFGKVCTLLTRIVYRGPALRSSCGSNAEARRASCPELGLHGAGMVLPFPGVLSLGRNRIELEIKESIVLFTHSPIGREWLNIYVIKIRCF